MYKLVTFFVIAVLFITPSASSAQFEPNGGSGAVEDPKEALKKERFVPTFFDAELFLKPDRFVSGEVLVLEGVIAYDQLFNVHWDELSQEKLNLVPFKVIRTSVGPERPSRKSEKVFLNERSFRVVLQLDDKRPYGKIIVPGFTLRYSWQDSERLVTKKVKLGPWKAEKVPIKVSASISSKVLHLGENALFTVRIARDKDIRILNQFIGILKDDKSSEAAKAEVKRWLKSLEVRRDSAFNLDSPDLKPIAIIGQSREEVGYGDYLVSLYNYHVAYYEMAEKLVKLPDVRIWYIAGGSKNIEGGYDEPRAVFAFIPEIFIASRLAGSDRRLDGPTLPQGRQAGLYTVYLFDYGLFAFGAAFFVAGGSLLFAGGRGGAGKEKIKKVKPVPFREASSQLLSFLYPVWNGGNLSDRAVKQFRERLFALIGSMLGMTNQEIQTYSANEMITLLTSAGFNRAHIAPVVELLMWCDRALSLSEARPLEGVLLPGEMLDKAKPFLRDSSPWYSLEQIYGVA